MTDRELLERFIIANDQAAFQALVESHGSMVLGVCRSILYGTHDAEDAFQATFLILARNASAIKQRDSLAPWLHRVAVRVATRTRLRASQRRAHERKGSKPERAPVHEPSDLNARPVVQEEVNRLPERYRLPVMLCYLEGKTNEEAALQLRCPVGTIKGRLWRARGRLRDRLLRRGVIPFPASQVSPP